MEGLKLVINIVKSEDYQVFDAFLLGGVEKYSLIVFWERCNFAGGF